MSHQRATQVNPADNPRYSRDFNELVRQAKKMGCTDAEAVRKAQFLMDYYGHHYQWIYSSNKEAKQP